MEINELTDFFGLPAQSDGFDRYLSARGIAKRPTFSGSPVDRIDWEAGGVSMIFDSESVYREFRGKPRESGEMIFSSLQVYGAINDSGFSPFQGQLPFQLTFGTTLAQAIAILGEPTLDHPSGTNRVYVWYGFHGNTISLCFLPNDHGVSFLAIEQDAIEPPEPMDW